MVEDLPKNGGVPILYQNFKDMPAAAYTTWSKYLYNVRIKADGVQLRFKAIDGVTISVEDAVQPDDPTPATAGPLRGTDAKSTKTAKAHPKRPRKDSVTTSDEEESEVPQGPASKRRKRSARDVAAEEAADFEVGDLDNEAVDGGLLYDPYN